MSSKNSSSEAGAVWAESGSGNKEKHMQRVKIRDRKRAGGKLFRGNMGLILPEFLKEANGFFGLMAGQNRPEHAVKAGGYRPE